jgi:LysM repeat protein
LFRPDREGELAEQGVDLADSTLTKAARRLRRQRRTLQPLQRKLGIRRPSSWYRDIAPSLAVIVGLALGFLAFLAKEAHVPTEPSSVASAQLVWYAADDLRPALDSPSIARVPAPATYSVEDGDTLLSIAYRFGTSVDAIQVASNIKNPNLLSVGQVLVIPPPRSLLQNSDPGATLRELADSFQVDPKVVASYNSLNAEAVDSPVGRQLVLVPPEPLDLPAQARQLAQVDAPTGAPAWGETTMAEAASEIIVYTVADGDTLLSIAQRLGVEASALAASNRLSDSNLLVAGRSLEVPLWARPAQTSTQARPAAEIGTLAAASVADAAARPQAPVLYEIAPGDTIGELAERFGVDSQTIISTNGLRNADHISVGDQLTILPVSGVLYTVQPGDTLSGIAAAFRVDLGPIIDFNYLDDADFISTGKELIIPGALPLPPAPPRSSSPVYYVVLPGDTVSGIAWKFGVAPEDIVAANKLRSADRIAIGDQLTILGGTGGSSGRSGSQQAVTRNLPIPASSSSSSSRTAPAGNGLIASVALGYNGSRYVYGGTTPAGFDCSGFVYYVYAKAGKGVSRGMWGQYGAGYHPSRSELLPGDMVFFQNTYMAGLSHNGIYIGNGQFIHAVDEKSGVKVSSLSESYWAGRWFGATRL